MSMSTDDLRDRTERAFRHFWTVGAIDERWDAWPALFTDDVEYVERIYGTMRGRDAVTAWIGGLMEQNRHVHAALEWYVIEGSRVVLGMQNRYYHPDGQSAPLDFAGLTVLDFTFDGLVSREEDWWDLPAAKRCYAAFEAARAEHGDEHLTETDARRLARDPWRGSLALLR